MPWQFGDLMKQITDSVDIPILTGEDIYLKEEFVKLIDMGAVDIIHPDLATSGGILETKKIGDSAQEHGVPMAMHSAGTPIACSRTCTARPRRRISSCWNTTRSTYRGGASWWRLRAEADLRQGVLASSRTGRVSASI